MGEKEEEIWFLDPKIRLMAPLLGASAMRGMIGFFLAPPRILIGPMGLRTALYAARRICEKGKAFIVTDKVVRKFAERVGETLREFDFETEIWDGALPEPPIECVQECADAMKKYGPDLIVAVGGGSVIDTAKVAWVVYEKPELDARKAAYLPLIEVKKVTDLIELGLLGALALTTLGLRKKALLAAIPTTSGTGSECTMAAVITDNSFTPPKKITLMLPEIMPDFSILLQEFAAGMPPKLAVSTGLDVLAHAFEGLCGILASDFSDLFSIKAIELTFQYLPRSYKYPEDGNAKRKMHIAASMGGLSISNGGNAITHALGHALGKVYKIHHGLAVGIFVPYVVQYYSKVTDKWLEIAKILKIKGESREEILAKVTQRIKEFFKELDTPTNLKDLGIDRKDFEANLDTLVAFAHEDEACLLTPRPTSPAELRKLFLCAYEGRDVDF